MGPGGSVVLDSTFTATVPPACDGHLDYASFRIDVK